MWDLSFYTCRSLAHFMYYVDPETHKPFMNLRRQKGYFMLAPESLHVSPVLEVQYGTPAEWLGVAPGSGQSLGPSLADRLVRGCASARQQQTSLRTRRRALRTFYTPEGDSPSTTAVDDPRTDSDAE